MLTIEESSGEPLEPSSCMTCGAEVLDLGLLKTHYECPACEYVTRLRRVMRSTEEQP
jgi:DNA-directed RNA polymerase subunit RPC12/RpoP